MDNSYFVDSNSVILYESFLSSINLSKIKETIKNLEQAVMNKSIIGIQNALKFVPNVPVETLENEAKKNIQNFESNYKIAKNLLTGKTNNQLVKPLAIFSAVVASVKNEDIVNIINQYNLSTYDYSRLVFDVVMLAFGITILYKAIPMAIAGTLTFHPIFLSGIVFSCIRLIADIIQRLIEGKDNKKEEQDITNAIASSTRIRG